MPLGIWLYHIMMLFVSIGQGPLITDGRNSNKMFFANYHQEGYPWLDF